MLARYITLKSIANHGKRGMSVDIDSMLVGSKHEYDETATVRKPHDPTIKAYDIPS